MHMHTKEERLQVGRGRFKKKNGKKRKKNYID